MSPRRLRAGFAVAAVVLGAGFTALPSTSQAGLSLEELIDRHHTLADGASLTPAAPSLAAPDAVSVAAFGGREPLPPLLRPVVEGAGGVQLRWSGGDPDGVAWRLGVGWSDRVNRSGARPQHGFGFDGSELSAPLGPGRVYASVQRRHWGPSWVGSLILDEGAEPVPAVGWRKTAATAFDNRWLAWLGPWNLDVFFGTLCGHTEPTHPRLWGARLQFAPLEGLELGLSRVVEWGGGGREENLGTFWDSLVGHDNVDGSAYNPSNQLGGFDARYTLRAGPGTAWSIYGQAIGEDEAGGLPSMYLGSAGVDVAFAAGAASMRAFVERANTVAGGIAGHDRPGVAYRHNVYLQGYTQQGQPLAFPAGGDVTLTSIGLIVDRAPYAAALMLHRGRAHSSAQLFAQPGRVGGADAQLAWRVARADTVGLTLAHWREPAAHRSRAQLWWEHRLR